MPKQSLAILTLIMVLLSMTSTLAHGDTIQSPAKITVVTTPEPHLDQLTSGDRCMFRVTVQNLGVTVQAGQVVNASIPNVKYSGNFTLETSFELRKQGRIFYNGQSISYITSLNNTVIDNYYSLRIPPINGTLNNVFTYNLTKGYEVFGIRPDEDMVLYFRINLFVQTYREAGESHQLMVGVKINTQRNDFYVQDFVKREYLMGKFLDIKGEIGQLKNINSAQVQIGKDYFYNVVSGINATMTRGDYVNSLQLILNYYQFDQPKLLALLYTNLNSTGITADNYIKLKQDYSNLNGRYNVLLGDFNQALKLNQLQQDNITQLEAKAQADRQNFISQSITGIIVLFLVGLLFGSRFHLFQ